MDFYRLTQKNSFFKNQTLNLRERCLSLALNIKQKQSGKRINLHV